MMVIHAFRSTLGRMGSSVGDYFEEVVAGKGLSYAVANSDIGRGDLGKAVERNSQAISNGASCYVGVALEVAVKATIIFFFPSAGGYISAQPTPTSVLSGSCVGSSNGGRNQDGSYYGK